MSGPDGFEEFVAGRYGALLRTARLLTTSHEDAEDLVQSALVRCVPVWTRIAADPEPYVRTVIVRENVSRWRRRRWRETASEHLPEVPVQQEYPVDRQSLAAALRRLPPSACRGRPPARRGPQRAGDRTADGLLGRDGEVPDPRRSRPAA